MAQETHRIAAMLLCLLIHCGGDSSGNGSSDEDACNLGELACPCNQGQCLGSLVCENDLCVSAATESSSVASTEGQTTESSDTASTTEESPTETTFTCTEPEILCDGECINPLADANNCGECGKTCGMLFDSGGCDQGQCQPIWSDCIDSSTLVLCSDVCLSQGFSGCVTAGCGDSQDSVRWYAFDLGCEQNSDITQGEATACETEPNGMNSDFYRCCCDQN